MYDKELIERLISFIESFSGIADKSTLADAVKKEFLLTQDRKVYSCNSFAIRFSSSKSKHMSNTVLSLSKLQKFDNIPFLVCIVAPTTNYLLLANSTFLKKISHSSRALRVDNIKGSFNGSDILMDYNNIENTPRNFERLYAYHAGLTFQDNLERLVESTNGIVSRLPKFEVTEVAQRNILSAISRAETFINSKEYDDLKQDLANRVSRVQGEIAIAAFIDNVNIRGRIIEFLIKEDGSVLKSQVINALTNKKPLPKFTTKDKLGDYSKEYPAYHTETDIKTKVLFLNGNPKAYNIDKLLEFLASPKSVYMIYLLGIDDAGNIITRLCSVFDKRLIKATHIQHHWAGRNTRGVTQFEGSALEHIIKEGDNNFDMDEAKQFINELIAR